LFHKDYQPGFLKVTSCEYEDGEEDNDHKKKINLELAVLDDKGKKTGDKISMTREEFL
jgi:hypothetical protein